ncbi:hypothetical protein KCU99_g5529, partial [Aureobasidium melanogenum]
MADLLLSGKRDKEDIDIEIISKRDIGKDNAEKGTARSIDPQHRESASRAEARRNAKKYRSAESDTQHLQSHQEYSSADAVHSNQHHQHHLPPHSPILKRTKHGEEVPPGVDPGPPSMVGKEGMPEPAPRPKGPKLKFTREDDALLVRLKETKNLTWKQIAEFFPGRSAGTLQVRYCTKLKAKTTLWNDDMRPSGKDTQLHEDGVWVQVHDDLTFSTSLNIDIQRLRTAMQDYDNDRWRFISSKVGSGFSAAACKAKAEEIEAEDMREDHGASSGSDDDQQDGVDGDGDEEEDAKGEAETQHDGVP